MVISADFKPYVQEILNFLTSITLKSCWTAEQINVNLVSKGYDVNLDDPTTWKYYLNLIGEYHSSDTPMTVASLDTLEVIPFTKEELVHHPRTVVSYYPGTDYFTNLCAQYPDQEDLIKSILFPVDSIETAISAPDLALLAWGNSYLEEPEQPMLIAALSKFLDIYRERWYFSFLEVEPYFHPANLGMLYAEMAAFLMAKRHQFINTPYVHSWHIRNYLQSKGLDDYSDVLTRKKQLFLYQNWDYLKINAGKQSNLIILIENLLADLGISIYGRRILMETQTGAPNCQLTPDFIPDNLLGSESKLVEEISAESTTDLQERLYSQGLTSSEDATTIATLTRKIGDTTKNNLLTKFLEIKAVDVDYRYQGMLDQFILDTLIKAITTDRYTALVMITDPLTGSTYWVSAKEALALYDYCVRMASRNTPTDIPTSYSYLLALKDKPDTPPTTVFYNGYTYDVRNFLNVDAFLGYWTWPTIIRTTTEFSQLLTEQWLLFLVKFQNIEYAHSGLLRFVLQSVMSAMIEKNVTDVFTLIPNFTTYAEWLSGAGIGFQSRIFNAFDNAASPTDLYGEFADNIMGALFTADATLRQFGDFTLSDNGYSRLRKLFMQLCSYTVRFLETSQSGSDYLYVGSFLQDTISETDSDSTTFPLLLTFSEQTTENCIVDQHVLSNTIAVHETTLDTDERTIDELGMALNVTTTNSVTEDAPVRIDMTDTDEVQSQTVTMGVGFDFSGFAP